MQYHTPAFRGPPVDIGGDNGLCRLFLCTQHRDILVDGMYRPIPLHQAVDTADPKSQPDTRTEYPPPVFPDLDGPLQSWSQRVDANDSLAVLPDSHHGSEIGAFQGIVEGRFRGLRGWE